MCSTTTLILSSVKTAGAPAAADWPPFCIGGFISLSHEKGSRDPPRPSVVCQCCWRKSTMRPRRFTSSMSSSA
eukprot:scaffold9503_cov27-Tisochrysis_lutea.AAC.4